MVPRSLPTLLCLTVFLTLGSEWSVSLAPAQARPQDLWIAQSVPDANPLAWTERYAEALEAQTDLVVTAQPLTATLTRIELAQWLAEFLGYVPDRAQAQIITDLTVDTPDYWTAQAVVQAQVMPLFDGNEFRPQGDMTKLEALAVLVRALQLSPPPEEAVETWISQYTDGSEVPEVGRPLIAMAGQAGLILNVPDPAQLTPNLILRRGEGIALIHQVLVYRQQLPAVDPPVAQLTPASVPVAVAPTPAPVPATSASDLEIFAVQVNPDAGTVPPGLPLTITAQATPGGLATVDIGPIQGIPMQEIQPGLYQGTYTVQSGDGLQSPDVGVQLTLGGRSTRLQQRQPQLALGETVPPIDSPVFSDPGSATPFPAPQPTPLAQQPPLPRSTVPTGIPTPQGDYPEFSHVRIEPERNLQAGDIVTLNLWGEAGASARFDFGSLATDQPMREIKPNVYEGTFVVESGVQVSNPVVKIVLSRDGLARQHAEIFPFRIDGAQAAFPSTPAPTSAPPGQPQIQSVSANTVGRQLQLGDLLQVTMQGDQGGTATFEIVNITPPISMREVSPGIYEGEVQIGANTPRVENGILQVTLERNGRFTTRSLDSLVRITP